MSRAFVLTTGRAGSKTWATACQHLTSHTAGHESRAHLVVGRLDYPDSHVETDNRLSWMLGMLDQRYGDTPVYVHLTRPSELVAASYARRYHVRAGIMPAFASGIIRHRHLPNTDAKRLRAAYLMVDTINANVDLFLRDKTKAVRVDITYPHAGFDRMCDLLGAEGDMDAAHSVLDRVHNASQQHA